MSAILDLGAYCISFLLMTPIYVVCFWLAFYIPGDIILSSFKIGRKLDHFVLSSVVGMVMWGWQAWIFGWSEIRWASYLYLIFFLVIWIQKNISLFKSTIKLPKLRLPQINKVYLLIIAFGLLSQLSAGWFSGWYGPNTVRFMGGNISDNWWHAALDQQLIKNIPPIQPVMSGTEVVHYHYWSNMIVADFIRIFHVPPLMTLFQFFFLLLSIFLGLTTIVLGRELKLPTKLIYLILFFLYFGGDLTPFVLLFLGKGLNFSMGAMEHGGSFLANFPRAFSIVVSLASLTLVFIWLRTRNTYLGVIVAFVCASLAGLKINTALFMFTGLAFLGLYLIIKRQWSMIWPLVLSVFLAFCIYYPVNKDAGGLLFTGFWRVRNYIVEPQLDLVRLEHARVIFVENHNWKAIFYDLLFLVVFIVITFGTKLIGLIQTKKTLTYFPLEFHIIMMPAIVVSFILGMFFIQDSGGANSFNFLVSVFIFLSFYAATTTFYIVSRLPRHLSLILLVAVLLVTNARTVVEAGKSYTNIYMLEGYSPTSDAMSVFHFLQTQTEENATILNGDFDTALFADRPIFISENMGTNILRSHNIQTTQREKIARRIYQTPSATEAAQLLKDNKIDYIYYSVGDPVESTPSATFFETIYSTKTLEVTKVDHEKIRLFLQPKNTLHDN